MEQSNKRTMLEQERAWFAYRCAETGSQLKHVSGEYKAYTKKFPTLVKTNGLGAALAFIYAKSSGDEKKAGRAYQLIYQQITEWLKRDEKQLIPLKDGDELVAQVVSCDSSSYRATSIEILAFMSWVRRFAEGMIDKEVEDA